MSRPAVLFDVDGTLVDTTYLHTLAWWRALEDAGIHVAMAAVQRLIGMGSSELLTELLGHDEPALSQAHGRHYQRLKGELRPLPGARELVKEASHRGATVVLTTSAEARDVDDLLRALDVGDAVSHIVHSADVERAKPAGDIFAAGLAAAQCAPEEAVAVGDTTWDVIAAAKVGVATVAVQTGGWSRAELLDAGAKAVYADPRELLSELHDSPIGRLLA
jgi:HAD superfamily hydrolase (TIGR01509 family)